MGRPSKLDDLVSKRIRNALEGGLSRRAAADAAGIGYSTFKGWLALGREGEQPYADLLAHVHEAEAEAEQFVVNKLFEAIKSGHVGAMCFFLERRRFEAWGKQEAATAEPSDVRPGEASTDLALAQSVVAALESRKVG